MKYWLERNVCLDAARARALPEALNHETLNGADR